MSRFKRTEKGELIANTICRLILIYSFFQDAHRPVSIMRLNYLGVSTAALRQ